MTTPTEHEHIGIAAGGVIRFLRNKDGAILIERVEDSVDQFIGVGDGRQIRHELIDERDRCQASVFHGPSGKIEVVFSIDSAGMVGNYDDLLFAMKNSLIYQNRVRFDISILETIRLYHIGLKEK